MLAESKKVLEGTPTSSELKAQHEKLTQASHKLAEVMYKAKAAETAAGAAPGGPADGSAAGAASEPKKDDTVIDAEYVDVDEKK
ncbi:MAG: hypothetical protein P4L40_05175 [Terracidiphilus sp.]|nr:hypothetical protein [Terracidiphilus sp.]